MGFGAATWLAALGTLAIPVAIHLWSRRRTRTVAIGSIRFLEARRPLSRRTIRLRNPWRLLLRLAMLAALILALAGPYLTDSDPGSRPERWIVVSPSVMGQPDVATALDTLGPRADAVRLLHSSWPSADAPAPAPSLADAMDTWSLLLALDQTLPPQSRITVLAPARTSYVSGTKPSLNSTVEWIPFDDPPGRSRGSTSPGTVALEIALFAGPDRQDDARYFQAAIGAMADAGDSISIRRYDPATARDSNAEPWIAWLSSDSVPTAITRRVREGAVLLTDAGSAPGSEVASSIAFDGTSIPMAHLTRRTATPDGVPLWRDGHGAPLLTVERDGSGWHYRLATRLHPSWTDLVLLGSFPEALRAVLGRPHRLPDLPMTVSQAMPAWAGPPSTERPDSTRGRSLFYPLWLMAVALFLIDAVMARSMRAV